MAAAKTPPKLTGDQRARLQVAMRWIASSPGEWTYAAACRNAGLEAKFSAYLRVMHEARRLNRPLHPDETPVFMYLAAWEHKQLVKFGITLRHKRLSKTLDQRLTEHERAVGRAEDELFWWPGTREEEGRIKKALGTKGRVRGREWFSLTERTVAILQRLSGEDLTPLRALIRPSAGPVARPGKASSATAPATPRKPPRRR